MRAVVYSVLTFFFFLLSFYRGDINAPRTRTRREPLTLCFQITLYAGGLASILHSKYTSSPSSMSDGFMLVPKASFNSGTSVTWQKKKNIYIYTRCLIRVVLFRKHCNRLEIFVFQPNVFSSNRVERLVPRIFCFPWKYRVAKLKHDDK